jgi:hypothetical protein
MRHATRSCLQGGSAASGSTHRIIRCACAFARLPFRLLPPGQERAAAVHASELAFFRRPPRRLLHHGKRSSADALPMMIFLKDYERGPSCMLTATGAWPQRRPTHQATVSLLAPLTALLRLDLITGQVPGRAGSRGRGDLRADARPRPRGTGRRLLHAGDATAVLFPPPLGRTCPQHAACMWLAPAAATAAALHRGMCMHLTCTCIVKCCSL